MKHFELFNAEEVFSRLNVQRLQTSSFVFLLIFEKEKLNAGAVRIKQTNT